MTTLTIEALWSELRAGGGDAQRRIDEAHPLDLYADYKLPNRPGFVAVCGAPAGHIQPLRALRITQGARNDGRWSLRITLNEPTLEPIFGALCRDIVSQTRAGVSDMRLAATVLARIDRWRSLLDRDAGGLGDRKLRGLFGELFVLQVEVLARLSPRASVLSWVGPNGSPQDFVLPSGTRLEVKTAEPTAETVKISSIEQLDCPNDPLRVLVLRAEKTGAQAPSAVGLTRLTSGLRERFSQDAETLADFDSALLSMGWHEHASHDAFAMRPLSIEAYDVDAAFPRLVRNSLPSGVLAAGYEILLPKGCTTIWRGDE